jgi:hypothetical protein
MDINNNNKKLNYDTNVNFAELERINKVENEDHNDTTNIEPVKERLQWDSYTEYILSIIGFVIDLGNVWRFPTVCYANGGGNY